ncbi:MAG: class I mannose-6-phosphate isomerase [Planctomycetes bacterium]|nr:class I mannose-6-phosphate isomerase [Planctomycetota bacterium]
MQTMYGAPLRFRAILKPRLWGGRRLARWAEPARPERGPIGEGWLLSDRPEARSVVASGSHRGRTLQDLLRQDPVSLVGSAAAKAGAAAKPFPLLVKVIDAAQPLSIQVHPSDDFARLHERDPAGKMEAWVVLRARPRATVVRGFRVGATRDEVARRLHEDRLDSILRLVRVKPGDAVWIPPGTVHSIGAGVCVAEFQQNSDTTYRLYDWNRIDCDGRRRELHVDRAFAVLRVGRGGPDRIVPRRLPAVGFERELLVDGAKFRLERRRWRGTARFHTSGESVLLFAAGGGMEVITRASIDPAGSSRHRTRLRRWEAVLMPASVGAFTVRSPRGATLLWAVPRWA